MRIGVLEYAYRGKRSGNVGLDIFLRHLSRPYEWCTPETAHLYDTVLVSVPSVYQVADYLRVAVRHRFDRRAFRIVLGGYGAVNLTILHGLYDVAAFGRVHDVADAIVDGHADAWHPSVCTHDDWVAGHTVSMGQAPLDWSEEFTGCPYMCRFCQFSHIRERQGSATGYVQGALTRGKSLEIMFRDIRQITEKPGRVRSALDGFSERLRYQWGKKISNDMVRDSIRHLGELARGRTPIVLVLYNITNFPDEGILDYFEFKNLIEGLDEPAGRVIVAIYSTTFRPSPLTPMQYEPAGVFPSILPMRLLTVRDTPRLLVKHAFSLEGPMSALQCVAIERCGEGDVDRVRRLLLSPGHSSLRSSMKAAALIDELDLGHLIGRADSLPTDRVLPC